MKWSLSMLLLCPLFIATAPPPAREISPTVLLEFSLGTKAGQFRAVPVKLNSKNEQGILAVYSEYGDCGSPNPQYFVFPKGVLSFVMFNNKGKQLWRVDLKDNVIADLNFCPVFPFDLDGDGAEEIWFVNNTDLLRPFASNKYVVEKLDANSGKSLGSFPFPMLNDKQSMGNLFRLFLMGGYDHDKPVLLTGQGTYQYGPMAVHAYNPDLTQRWRKQFNVGEKGARGSHMSPMSDFNNDGVDEIMWGERCINVSDGSYLFVADYDVYTGHSDVIQPVLRRSDNKWHLYTCRENGEQPRLVFFDDKGKRIWSDLTGHVDIGYVAHWGNDGKVIAAALEIDKKFAAEGGGVVRTDGREYMYDLWTGKRIDPPFKEFIHAVPVDFNGDGIHELWSHGVLHTSEGKEIKLPDAGSLAHASHFLNDYAGEQIITWDPSGTVRVWGDKNAFDTEAAKKRYSHNFYKRNQKLTASGMNIKNLGGI